MFFVVVSIHVFTLSRFFMAFRSSVPEGAPEIRGEYGSFVFFSILSCFSNAVFGQGDVGLGKKWVVFGRVMIDEAQIISNSNRLLPWRDRRVAISRWLPSFQLHLQTPA